jgi:GNAT superfamily N-acetyltransferase
MKVRIAPGARTRKVTSMTSSTRSGMSSGDRSRRPESTVSGLPSTGELVSLGAPVVLRDGSHVRVRPGHHSDRELLLRGFERLSAESRYRRFLVATPELSRPMVDFLTAVDHHDHEAIVALDESGEGVGVARYVRHADRPEAAEAAVTVIDDWQGRGLGTLLLEVLSARAREEGVTTFTALMLGTNQEMMDLVTALVPVRIVDRESGTVEVDMPIPDVGLAPALRKLLRVAAKADVVIPRRGIPAAALPGASGRS